MALSRDGDVPTLLLDAGTGLRHLGPLLGGRPFTGSILLSHLHWDHVQGLPFSPVVDNDEARVDVHLPAQGQDPGSVLARFMSPPTFPISPTGLRGRWRFCGLDEGCHQLEGLAVLAREIPHKGGRTFGYRVSDGRRSVAYLPDHLPGQPGSGPSGLGELHDAALELADGVDLLIHDSHVTAAEFPELDWLGHAAAEYALELAVAAEAKRLLLFHHAPTRTDDQLDQLLASMATAAASTSVAVEVARDGAAFRL